MTGGPPPPTTASGTRSWVVHLVGFPAVGKRTVAVELVAASATVLGQRLVLVDNHLTSNPILSVLGQGGSGTVGDEVWDLVDEVRDVVHRAITTLAPPERSFVFTNAATGDANGSRAVARIHRLARTRGSTYVPVVLSCDGEELLSRVPSADRARHGKWTDPGEVAAHIHGREVLRPESPHLLDLDTTSRSPAQSAQLILDHLIAVDTPS